MKCPADNENLLMTDRSGLEIDYCPQCRGIWLDRRELDKIIDRSSTTTEYPPQNQSVHHAPKNDYSYKSYDDKHHKKRKKESFLSDLFDY